MNITQTQDMTILKIGQKIDFFEGIVEPLTSLVNGQIYNLDIDPVFSKVYLSEAAPLSLPEKIYDFDKDFRQQVIKTLRHPKGNMNVGVLLEGYKGQGKSVIAKLLAIESGLPVIVINKSISTDIDFISFLNKIKQDHVIFIDEFEKLFPEKTDSEDKVHGQNSFLSYLDGLQALTNKRLVIFTSNSEIGDKFINRPSRIRYYKKYNYLSKAVFDMVVDDKLINKDFKADLEDNLDITTCTVDILTSIIEEINIHELPYSQFKTFFNNKERNYTYSIYRQDSKGMWDFIEERVSSKQIGVDNEHASHILGYQIRVIKNTEDVIYYEMQDYEDRNDNESPYRKFIFKALKQPDYSYKKHAF